MSMDSSRYVIGIDLGTTNSCVAYLDTDLTANPRLMIQTFSIPQLTSKGSVEVGATLPSACYLLEPSSKAVGSALPWLSSGRDYVVGEYARELGVKVPTRFIFSAKSWLCNVAASRRDKILPLEAASPSARISPVEATARTLVHIREGWNYVMGRRDPSCEFEQQEVVLTVPASFDEVARALTLEAARLAGYTKMTLLEEPQAAFYSWIAAHEATWEQKLQSGETILVCDVGGGTTDFSLIEVQQKEKGLAFQRMAVGRHLLLGGDNMDAAVAHFIEKQLPSSVEVDAVQWHRLLHQGRLAKEKLLGGETTTCHVVLQGSGSGVVGGTVTADLACDEVLDLLLGGFFGKYSWSDAKKVKRTEGIRSVGLPYEDEPSITKHLACFLDGVGRQIGSSKFTAPDYILFNGGAMKPKIFQEAIAHSLAGWFPGKEEPKILSSASLDLAVSRGAAYFGKVRRGLGVRIGGGSARGYYLGVDVKEESGVVRKALTILPRGSEEGSKFVSSEPFLLLPNTPVSFQLMTSNVRLMDLAGELVAIDPQEMQQMPLLKTVLRYGKQKSGDESSKIPVELGGALTEIGTLELWLKSKKTDHKWLLEFQIRSASGEDNSLALLEGGRSDELFDESYLLGAQQVIQELFTGALKPEKLMERLEEALDRARGEWSSSVLRGLWNSALKQAPCRFISNKHEARWWNLVGFLLRPGYGYPLDDHRMKQLWQVMLGDKKGQKAAEVALQRIICCRRLAGGFSKGQQLQLANELLPGILNKKNGKIEIPRGSDMNFYSEQIRALGALELIDISLKIQLGDALVGRIIAGEATPADYWALGRLGARHLVYGSIANVVSKDICIRWAERLLDLKITDNEGVEFVLLQLLRRTDQRELRLPEQLSDRMLERCASQEAIERLKNLLSETFLLSQREQERLLGDQLPAGLVLEQR